MKTQRTLWPFAIIAMFAIFIIGTGALVVIACTHQTDLVSSDYYEQEVNFQKRIDQIHRTSQIVEPVAVDFDSATQTICVSLPLDKTKAEISGRIQLYRPSATALDREVRLQLDGAGRQLLDAAALLPGLWKIRVHWTAQGQDYFSDQKIIVKRRAERGH